MNIRFLDISMLIGAAVALFLGGFGAFAAQCESAQENVFRLHILANSDTDEDQNLKYDLRDYILSDLSDIFGSCQSSGEMQQSGTENLDIIAEKCSDFIKEKGYTYSVHCEIVNMYFTTRVYNNTTLPAGNYDALRIIIGSGEGHNWWCVLFPPLCLPAAVDFSDTECLDEGKTKGKRFDGENEDTVFFTAAQSREVEESKNVEIKFAVYEFFASLFGG